MKYEILFGNNKGKIMELSEAKLLADDYVDEYLFSHTISFNPSGNYKDYTTGKILLRQVKAKKVTKRTRKLKVDKGYIKRLKEKVRNKYKLSLIL